MVLVHVSKSCYMQLSKKKSVFLSLATILICHVFVLLSLSQLADMFINEVEHGIPGTSRGGLGEVRCGIIGEMGCSHPLTQAEERGLKAAALAQRKTGEHH